MSADGPRRLLDYGDDLNGLLRGALESERRESADEARLARIAQAMTLATASSAPPPSAEVIEPAAPTSSGWLASKGPFLLLAAAALAGFIAVVRTDGTPTPQEPRPIAAPPPTMTTPAVISPAAEPPAQIDRAVATTSPADLPSAPPPASTARSSKSSTTNEADEIALLARAHDALRGDPAKSLALCRQHESQFSGGHFAQEREAVAIEALIYLGRTEEARRRWNEFRGRYPSSSHRVHLESLFAR